MKMQNIYLYGASDDCCECETDFCGDYESYEGIKINHIIANYCFDGEWGIHLVGNIPDTWTVRAIKGNCCSEYRDLENAGQFIHIQIPDDEAVKITEIETKD
jgi:hypothetical protein